MSATLDARRGRGVSRRLPGRRRAGPAASARRSSYAPGAVAWPTRPSACSARPRGDVLCFLPGAPRDPARDRASSRRGRPARGVDVVAAARLARRRRAGRARCAPSARRRIIVATNIAETSLTVPGVTAVVDTGLHKVARYDADRGDRQPRDSSASRRTPPISAPAAPARVAPGVVRRLWDARDRLRPHREPEIHRVDLSAAVLDVIAWGGDPRRLEWFERPREDALDAALALLERLGAVAGGALTGDRRADAAAAAASAAGAHARRRRRRARDGAGVRAAVGAPLRSPPRDRRRRRPICCRRSMSGTTCRRTSSASRARSRGSPPRCSTGAIETLSDAAFRQAVLAGYPDRVAQRREAGVAARAARVGHRRDRRAARAASATASSSSRSTCRRRLGRAIPTAAFASPAASSASGCSRRPPRSSIGSTRPPAS